MNVGTYGASKTYTDKLGYIRGTPLQKQVNTTLFNGAKSLIMFVVGDSVSGTSSNWPGLFATKLAQKYPTYNVKHCQYDNGNSRYGAWANLVANGTERYLAIASGKTPPANQ